MREDAFELPRLEVVVSPPEGPIVTATLTVASLVIGTDPECDVVVTDARVSRRHCEITLTERGVMIKDLGSKTGSFVDDVRIVESWLHPGTSALIGDSTVTLRVAGSPSRLPISEAARFGQALGSSIPMRVLFAKLERAAPTLETILLLGESGTGKELLARGIHEMSPRRSGPFVVFDCSVGPPNLIESELFGYARGAFTDADQTRAGLLEQANGGTLFLDEIGELALDLQPKLLRALEARQFRRLGSTSYTNLDVRVIAATHRDLLSRIARGAFREDLYYRLAVVEAVVPPLRERKDDIPLLVSRFLAAQTPPRSLADLPPNAIHLLRTHDWPGNVRELRNTVARLVLFPHLGEQAITKPAALSEDIAELVKLPFREARELMLEQFERAYILEKLRAHAGNLSRAARATGISRQSVRRMMDRYGIVREG